jgi:hypothetical protein
MQRATEFLIKSAMAAVTDAISNEASNKFLPQSMSIKSLVGGREALMDLGEEGAELPRRQVKKRLKEIIGGSSVGSFLPYVAAGGVAGAVGVPATLWRGHKKLTDMLNMKYPMFLAKGLARDKLLMNPAHVLLGAGLGAGAGVAVKLLKQRRVLEAANDEYNRLRLAKLYK